MALDARQVIRIFACCGSAGSFSSPCSPALFGTRSFTSNRRLLPRFSRPGLLVLLAPLSLLPPTPPSVEWETLLFFAGLFVMVGALVKTGVIGAPRGAHATGGDPLTASMLILFVSALLSGIIDSIKYVAAMSPVVLELTQNIEDPTQTKISVVVPGSPTLEETSRPSAPAAPVVVLGDGQASRAPHSRFLDSICKGAVVTGAPASRGCPIPVAALLRDAGRTGMTAQPPHVTRAQRSVRRADGDQKRVTKKVIVGRAAVDRRLAFGRKRFLTTGCSGSKSR